MKKKIGGKGAEMLFGFVIKFGSTQKKAFQRNWGEKKGEAEDESRKRATRSLIVGGVYGDPKKERGKGRGTGGLRKISCWRNLKSWSEGKREAGKNQRGGIISEERRGMKGASKATNLKN